MGTRGEPPGERAATSDFADSRPHSAPSTPPLLTAAAVLMEALSPLRCAALVLLCPTTPTLLAPPSCSSHSFNDKYDRDKYKNKQTSTQTLLKPPSCSSHGFNDKYDTHTQLYRSSWIHLHVLDKNVIVIMTNTTKTNTQIHDHILDKSLVKTGIVITTDDITQTSIE